MTLYIATMCYPFGFVIGLIVLSNIVTALAVAHHIRAIDKIRNQKPPQEKK